MRYLDFKDNQLHGTGWHLWFGHCFATFQTWATGKDCGDGYCRREEYIQTMTSFWLLLLMGRVILWTLLIHKPFSSPISTHDELYKTEARTLHLVVQIRQRELTQGQSVGSATKVI